MKDLEFNGMEEIDWKRELLDSMQFNQKEEKLLKHGASSLVESWCLGRALLNNQETLHLLLAESSFDTHDLF